MAADSAATDGAGRGSADARIVVVLAAFLVLLVACALYFAAIAVGVLDVGPEPGDDPPGYGVVLTLAALSMLTAGVALPLLAWRRDVPALVPAALLAVSAPCAWTAVVTRFLSYDSYYAPTLRRYSEGGVVAGRWIVVLLAITLAAGALTRFSIRAGLLATAVALWLCAVTFVFMAAGH